MPLRCNPRLRHGNYIRIFRIEKNESETVWWTNPERFGEDEQGQREFGGGRVHGVVHIAGAGR